MVLAGQLAIGSFDIFSRSGAFNTQGLIVCGHKKANSTVIILFAWDADNYFLAGFSGTGVPSTFLCTLMFLQISFLVFSSVVHTRLTSADPNTDIENASKTIDIASFIFIFL
jgi:hypothetical protein